MTHTYIRVLCLLLVLFTVACQKKDGEKSQASNALATTLVLADRSDVDNFNPIISSTLSGGNAISMIYPGITTGTFDTATGTLIYQPSVAKSWTISPDFKSITYNLRSDVKWTDGTPLTSHDFKFSYQSTATPSSPVRVKITSRTSSNSAIKKEIRQTLLISTKPS